MRRGGKGDAIPLIAFHNAPLFKAGFFTQIALDVPGFEGRVISNPLRTVAKMAAVPFCEANYREFVIVGQRQKGQTG
jgi:hypothetical protein